MSRRYNNALGIKTPKGDKLRTWKRWKEPSKSRDRNIPRFNKRVIIYEKKFGKGKEDEFSFTG